LFSFDFLLYFFDFVRRRNAAVLN